MLAGSLCFYMCQQYCLALATLYGVNLATLQTTPSAATAVSTITLYSQFC